MDGRRITTHRLDASIVRTVPVLDDAVEVYAGPAGPGGAADRYELTLRTLEGGYDRPIAQVQFQRGPAAGRPDGLSMEALLAICLDRLEGLQSGPHACESNDAARMHLTAALEALKARTVNVLAAQAAAG